MKEGSCHFFYDANRKYLNMYSVLVHFAFPDLNDSKHDFNF